MSDVLTRLYQACDPLEPATSEYYVDCSAVRGNNAFTRRFLDDLNRTQAGHFRHCLFSGHLGSGKSSELEHLRQTLETCPPNADGKRYFPIYLDAGEYLDDYDVTPTDIFLAIVAEVAATFRDRLGIELKDTYFAKRLEEIKKFFLSDVELKEGELSLAAAKIKIQRLQKAPEARQKVRETLLPKMTSLLNEINTVFAEARLKIRQRKYGSNEAPYTEIVIILDNLEKIQRFDGRKEGEESQRELFIEKAPQLLGLEAHVVYTVPLPLIRLEGKKLETVYGTAPFVLPMIKVEERKTHAPYEQGKQRLRRILEKRAGTDALNTLFEEDALDWLLTYCGGDIRDLMNFVRRAINEVESPPITLKAAQRSLAPTIGLLSTSLSPTRWIKLAMLERDAEQQIDNSDSDYRAMLEQVCILEYINGGVEADPFNLDAPWYAVHPIVRQLNQFKHALADVDAKAADANIAPTHNPATNQP